MVGLNEMEARHDIMSALDEDIDYMGIVVVVVNMAIDMVDKKNVVVGKEVKIDEENIETNFQW